MQKVGLEEHKAEVRFWSASQKPHIQELRPLKVSCVSLAVISPLILFRVLNDFIFLHALHQGVHGEVVQRGEVASDLNAKDVVTVTS